MDPLLDDSVSFVRRLAGCASNVFFRVVPNMPHGFLNFYDASSECAAGVSSHVSLLVVLISIVILATHEVMEHIGYEIGLGTSAILDVFGHSHVPKEMAKA